MPPCGVSPVCVVPVTHTSRFAELCRHRIFEYPSPHRVCVTIVHIQKEAFPGLRPVRPSVRPSGRPHTHHPLCAELGGAPTAPARCVLPVVCHMSRFHFTKAVWRTCGARTGLFCTTWCCGDRWTVPLREAQEDGHAHAWKGPRQKTEGWHTRWDKRAEKDSWLNMSRCF